MGMPDPTQQMVQQIPMLPPLPPYVDEKGHMAHQILDWLGFKIGWWTILACALMGAPIILSVVFRVKLKKILGERIAVLNDWFNK